MQFAAVDKTIAYLESPEALESIGRDPYWPKWDSPWWHMTLLWELDLAHLIPKPTVRAMVEKLRSHYLPFFPINDADLPPGTDAQRDVACHCAVGTMLQVLSACGVDMRVELPWMPAWLLKYQLPDGGLNCDAAAYRGSKKSSFLSTLPALEAVLGLVENRPASAAEELFLHNGAHYLIAHKVFRSASGNIIEERWLRPCFPRFFDYDILRGLSFLARWAQWSRQLLPREAVTEAAVLLESAFGSGPVHSIAPDCLITRSPIPQSSGWTVGPALPFALLKECAKPGPKETLTYSWHKVRAHLGIG